MQFKEILLPSNDTFPHSFHLIKMSNIVFVGICKNASSSLWSMIHGKAGKYPTAAGQHDTLMQRQSEAKQASKIIIVTRHPYSRWISMYTFLQYQKQWKGLHPDIILDRIRQAQIQKKLDPIGIARTNLDIIFCPQWTWIGKTPSEAKKKLEEKEKIVVLNFHQLKKDFEEKVPEMNGAIVEHQNRTSDQRRQTYLTLTPQQKRIVQQIWKEDFELFGWDKEWDPESGNNPQLIFR